MNKDEYVFLFLAKVAKEMRSYFQITGEMKGRQTDFQKILFIRRKLNILNRKPNYLI